MSIKLVKPAPKLQSEEPISKAGLETPGAKVTSLNTSGTNASTGQKRRARKPPRPITPDAEFLDVAQLASRWNVSTRHVHRMIANGELEATRFGRAVRVPLSTVRLWEVSQRR